MWGFNWGGGGGGLGVLDRFGLGLYWGVDFGVEDLTWVLGLRVESVGFRV